MMLNGGTVRLATVFNMRTQWRYRARPAYEFTTAIPEPASQRMLSAAMFAL